MTNKQQAPPPRRGRTGRPRSTQSRLAILRAAREELADKGFRRVTIESVSSRAGVGKATVYRWWPNKAAILFDAVNSTDERYPEFGGSSETRAELLDEIRGVINYFSTETGGAFLDLVAESRFDPTLQEALSGHFVAARRRATREVLDKGIEQGQTPDTLDIESFMDMVWGAIYYRFLVLHDRPSPAYAERLLNQAWPQKPETTTAPAPPTTNIS